MKHYLDSERVEIALPWWFVGRTLESTFLHLSNNKTIKAQDAQNRFMQNTDSCSGVHNWQEDRNDMRPQCSNNYLRFHQQDTTANPLGSKHHIQDQECYHITPERQLDEWGLHELGKFEEWSCCQCPPHKPPQKSNNLVWTLRINTTCSSGGLGQREYGRQLPALWHPMHVAATNYVDRGVLRILLGPSWVTIGNAHESTLPYQHH